MEDIVNAKTDSTITFEVLSNAVDEYPLSKLIDSVRYVELDNSDNALLSVIRNIKVINDRIYVLDLDSRLKCFDRQGRFIRDAYKRGGGPEEIGHFIDFDVDENNLYIFDGAKVSLFTFTHDGVFVKREKLPFRVDAFKRIPDNKYLFLLSRFSSINDKDEDISDKIVLTDDKFNAVQSVLHNIEDSRPPLCVYPFFENSAKPKYFCDNMGYGLFEQKDSVLFMKYYLDFGGKYFNEDLSRYKFTEDEEKYFAMRSPLRNEDYILQAFYSGLKRERTLLIRLKDNKMMFIKKLTQDKSDVFSFTFTHTCGYDFSRNEFYGICNYLDLDDIPDDKDKSMLRQKMTPEAQPFLLRQNTEATTNCILMFYKLRRDIEFNGK
jgi:hypothetical protein